MSLFLCPKCNRYYQLSSNHEKYISQLCDTNKQYGEAIVVCACGAEHVSGGESSDYLGDGTKGIMCFGRDVKTEDKDKLLTFPAIMLEECIEGDVAKTASTYHSKHFMDPEGRTIHLRPEQPKVGIERALELRKELFNIANSYSGDKTGLVAVTLHWGCNKILEASELLEELKE